MIKRYLLGILVFICFIFTIYARRQIEVYMGWRLPYLSAKMREEVEKAYEWRYEEEINLLEAEESDIFGTRYYGTYNGAVVFVPQVEADSMSRIEIDGEVFEWYDGRTVYKDGKFVTMEEACGQGILTLKDIKIILRVDKHYWWGYWRRKNNLN